MVDKKVLAYFDSHEKELIELFSKTLREIIKDNNIDMLKIDWFVYNV